MKTTTIIIGLASIGFILMGLFIMYSKSISKVMVNGDNDERTKKFIKQNAYINISVGIVGVIIALIDVVAKQATNIIIILFISLIFISSLCQSALSKKYRKKL